MFGLEYRPKTFKEVIGLDLIKKILISNIKTGRYARGYIFEGSYSSGKTTISRIFARGILCENPLEDYSPCNVCNSCKSFLSNSHPCYIEIDAANNGTKDKIQEIKEFFRFDTIIGRGKRVILFDEAHNISKEGKDALLIELEKERSNVILLFCTTESHKMPETIKSRCYVFRLPEPTEKDILNKLKFICESKKIEYDEDALYKMIICSGRHYRDAENKLSMLVSLYDKVSTKNVEEVFSVYDSDIVNLLLFLSNNLTAIIDNSLSLLSKMNAKDVYESILRILNDAIKMSNGVTFVSPTYSEMLKKLVDFYGDILYSLLDYFLSKKIIDSVFLQSYLFILYFKFMKGDFKKEQKKINAEQEKDTLNVTNSKKDDFVSVLEKLNPWERDAIIREIKNQGGSGIDKKEVPNLVSGWEVSNTVEIEESKIEIAPEVFKNILKRGGMCNW